MPTRLLASLARLTLLGSAVLLLVACGGNEEAPGERDPESRQGAAGKGPGAESGRGGRVAGGAVGVGGAQAPGGEGALVDSVLLVSLDTLRADRLEAYGFERPTSPNLEALASRGVVFEQARAQSSQTAPSHASLFSSTTVAVHGVINVHGGQVQVHKLPAGVRTLAEVVQERGWETAAFVSGGNLTRRMDMDRGFDLWDETFESVEGRAEAALAWILAPERGPFLALLHTYQVHAPYLPPRAVAERFVDPAYDGPLRPRLDEFLALPEKAAWEAAVGPAYWEGMLEFDDADVRFLSDLYDAEIRHLDDVLRDLFSRLLRGGLRERLAIVVFSDHGEEFRDHGKYQHDQIFEEHVHVPLIVRLPPALERAGWTGRVAAPVALIDVAPTVAELLGVPSEELPWQGRSLVPLLGPGRAQHASTFEARPVFSELIVEPGPQYHSAVVFNGWKYMRVHHANVDHTVERLFDLRSDPLEKQNLIDSVSADAVRARDALRELLERQAERNLDLVRRVGEGTTEELDPEMRARLEALGYLGDDAGG